MNNNMPKSLNEQNQKLNLTRAIQADTAGLNAELVRDISKRKNEPKWMLEYRLQAFEHFIRTPNPTWGPDISDIDYNALKYYVSPDTKKANSWQDLPDDIKDTYDKLGIPDAEKQRLVSGVAAQYESEVIYNNIQQELSDLGVIFTDTDTGLKQYPELFKQYFASAVPFADNRFSAMNSAFWSGGSFVYIPKNTKVDIPLQAYFRINTQNLGQFERTLIIVDQGSFVHYIEGCTAPIYNSDSLHSGVVEIIVLDGARVRYTTIQNWSNNVYNLVTQRALVGKNATMEWVDGNIGSKVTMKYPACILQGEGANAQTLSLSFAGKGQVQDSGAKMIHLAPKTKSSVIAKSIAREGGVSSYRGIIKVSSKAAESKTNVVCDALLVDDNSRTDTYPTMDINHDDVQIGHEASVAKITDDQLFYLMSRGISEQEATAMIVRGFIEPIAKEIPMEYALELNRLIQLQMQGSVG